MTPVGLPHSEIPGSKRACRSPRHIAACHVLHRLSVPRHPPSTLSNLTIKCLDLMRSAATYPPKRANTSCISLIYNPYSIVNERWIAKIDAATRPLPVMSTAEPRGLAVLCAAGDVQPRDSIAPSSRAVTGGRRLVELIGIEPTTPWLQTRCSPS
jgi:hypothetical protein